MALGSGVAGLSVLTHTHTPPLWTSLTQAIPLYPRFCCSFLEADIFFLPLHELLSTHELQIRVLPVSGASADKNGAVFPHAGPPLSVPFLVGSDCLTTHRYSSVWGAHEELRAILLHPRLTVKGHSRFWLSHRLVGSFSLL